jgi:hypothetical protein
MFEHIRSFPIEGFQIINAFINDDGFVEIAKPDDGDFYHLKYIIATTYVTDTEAVYCLRNVYEYLSNTMLPVYGFNDKKNFYDMLFHGNMEEALSVIYDVQFHYADLNNYVQDAELIYYGRKKRFQCPEEIRRSIALIGMAYIVLSGGPQVEFIPLTEEEIAQRNAYSWQGYLEQSSLVDAPPCAATGLCRMICNWRRDGKTELEIAEILYDDGKWCSLSQIGALLHSDDTRISADSMKKYAARLLAKPKE